MKHAVKSCRALSIVLIGLFGAKANAEAPIPPMPSLFAVSGLKDGDHLNVRSGPSAKSTDIGDLQRDQKIEVTALETSVGWARIVWGEGSAWVSTKYISPIFTATMSPSGLPANMVCSGTEPFWSLSLKDGKEFSYKNMDDEPSQSQVIWNGVSPNNILRLGVKSTDWTLFAQKMECRDGMSDQVYGIRVDMISNSSNTMLSGCCALDIQN